MLYTPNGSMVLAQYDAYPEFSATERNRRDTAMDKTYPNAIRLGPSTVKYNCHSYAWYQQSSSNLYWINRNYAESYWTDGSYYQTSPPRVGMKMSWVTSDHSGVVSKITFENGSNIFYAKSKWGDFGLYEHNIGDSPYSGSKNYYSRA